MEVLKITPSQNKPERFNEQELEAFVNDLNQYDAEHNKGAWMGKGLAAFMMQHMEEENEEGETNKRDKGLDNLRKKIENNLTLDELEQRHNPTLAKLGLSLESPNKEGDIDENEIYAIGAIQINLENKEEYLKFLRSIEADQLSETQKKILEMTVDKIVYQVQNEYNLENGDDRLLELFSGMREIVNEYERLGFGEKVKDFKDYLEHSSGGYLKEYILAKNKKLFEPIGEGFNFSTFQIDASYDYYIGRWENDFFLTLKQIAKNPDAKELYNTILRYGKDCIAFAEKDSRIDTYNEEYVKSIRKAITEIKDKIYTMPELS